jgi:4-hydroxy-3-polyprenylbenzoate decarboxylase
MTEHSLRAWLSAVDAIGELSQVSGADAATEIGGLVDLSQERMGNPAILFDKVRGYPSGHRLVANVLTSYPRLALTLGLSPEFGPRELVSAWRSQLKDLPPRPAQLVERGPVLEHVLRDGAVDATRFPAPVWHEGDGGRYLGTGCIVVMRDPDTGWVNSGTYRVQLHDERTLGLYISPGKHGRLIRDKYWARGKACPVAISMGHDPLLLLLGGLEVPYGTCEYDVAGAIWGEPLEVVAGPLTGLPVPAHAELVMEGEVPVEDLRAEGPFGEWAGYYASGQKPEPIVNVQSVLHRDDPIVLGCIPGKPPNDNTFFRSPMRAALIWDELEKAGVPGISGVWSHEAGGGRMLNIVSIKQLYPGHAKQVGMATASCHAGAYANRYVIVVDEDIDPTDTNQVLWALCTRTDVSADIDTLRRCWSTPLDPMAYAGADGRSYYNDRLVIDACKPYDRVQTFPAIVGTSDGHRARLQQAFPALFGPDGKIKSEPAQAGAATANLSAG